MIATAGTANATCRTTKYQLQWNRGLTAAIIDDALYSMTTPKHASNRTVANRIQSVFRRCDMLFLGLQAVDDLLENFPAMLVTAELVEARARRREQHRVARRAVPVAMSMAASSVPASTSGTAPSSAAA